MNDGTTVLIVGTDADDLGLLDRLFTRAGFATSEATTGEGAVETARKTPPTLVVLDLELPDTSGYEVCVELREHVGEHLPIIMLSAERTESTDRVAGLLIGADDYLTKPFDPDEVLARARRLLARVAVSQPILDLPLTGRESDVLRLTGRESEVLQLLATGLTQDAIAQRLFISPKTVGTHIQRILVKLGVHSRAEAVALAYQSGLMVEPERPAES